MSMLCGQDMEIGLQAALLDTADIQEAVDSSIQIHQPYLTRE
jgi:hypothetical protein